MIRTYCARITVLADPLHRQQGWLIAGPLRFRVSLGRSGITRCKREGDGATPAGSWRLLQAFVRRDGYRFGASGLKTKPIRRQDGWCDDVTSPRYNQPVTLPFRASHEDLWRSDHLYDVVIDSDWNRRPAIKGRGSAIFIHLRRLDGGPTAGCIALSPRDMRILWPYLGCRTRLIVH
jgi:L,D-peptidoglycan transpeptidase YkuD (ErfK/YbiS/YcfS/YnhG family)